MVDESGSGPKSAVASTTVCAEGELPGFNSHVVVCYVVAGESTLGIVVFSAIRTCDSICVDVDGLGVLDGLLEEITGQPLCDERGSFDNEI